MRLQGISLKRIIYSFIIVMTFSYGSLAFGCPPGYSVDCEDGWCCMPKQICNDVGPESCKLIMCTGDSNEGWCVNQTSTSTTTIITTTTTIETDYPPNPHNCCMYCPYEGQELCFWNDLNFLYMSIDPDDIGGFCIDLTTIQDGYQYDLIAGYDELDNLICGDIYIYTEVRFLDSDLRPPNDPTRPMTLIIERCEGWSDPSFLEYPSGCGAVTTTTIQATTTTSTSSERETLTGFVTDGVTGEPLTMAWNKAYDENENTVFSCTLPPGCVSTDGHYKAYPPNGLITITWHCDGYESQTKSIEIVAGENTLDFELMPSGIMSTTTTTTQNQDKCVIEIPLGENSEETEFLRYFRDNILRHTPQGREIIRLYYQWSPIIVQAMEEDEEFQERIKELIYEILPMIEAQVDH